MAGNHTPASFYEDCTMTTDQTPQGPLRSTLRDIALAAVPLDLREPLLTLAIEHHIANADDPFWTIAAATANALAAAKAAGDAAWETGTAVASIRDEVYQGAAKASADIKATIETSITGTVNSAFASAAQAGADALRKAAADLPAVAHAEQGRIVQEWRSALADAARDSAFAGVVQRLSVNVVALVILVAGIFVGGLLTGGAGIEFIMATQHRLVPSPYRLLVTPRGKPECGALVGHTVCLARRARHPT